MTCVWRGVLYVVVCVYIHIEIEVFLKNENVLGYTTCSTGKLFLYTDVLTSTFTYIVHIQKYNLEKGFCF